MAEFVVHMRDSGVNGRWWKLTGEGETFAGAAVRAVVQNHIGRRLDLAKIPHRVDFVADHHWFGQHVVFYETEPRRVFDPLLHGGWGPTRPGDVWFSNWVIEGEPDDCPSCGGRGIDDANPFRQCWRCGDRDARVEHTHIGGSRYVPVRETCGSGKATS